MADKDGQKGGQKDGQSSPASNGMSKKKVRRSRRFKNKQDQDQQSDNGKGCTCGQYIEDSVEIECVNCKNWFHLKCVHLGGLTEEGTQDIECYVCPFCIVASAVLPPPQNHAVIEKADEKLRHSVACVVQKTLKTELTSILELTKPEALTSVLETVEKDISESSKNVKTYLDAFKTDIKTTIKEKPPVQLIKETVRQIDADQLERVKRECNVVINNVPEESDGKKSKDNDLNFLYDVCRFGKNEVVSCFRAGKVVKRDCGSEPLPRPLVVKLRSKDSAAYWSNEGRGWRVKDSESENVYWINQDLNRADREAQFFAREQRRKRLLERAKLTDQKPNH